MALLASMGARVAISGVLLTVFLGAVVPNIMLYSEQKELQKQVSQISKASTNFVKLQTSCSTSLASISVNDLVTRGLLNNDWSELESKFTINIEYKTIRSTAGTIYTKPSFVVVQYQFPTIQDAKPFYELADSFNQQNLFFVSSISSSYELNSYIDSKTGCAVL